jgi:hypothetical protein
MAFTKTLEIISWQICNNVGLYSTYILKKSPTWHCRKSTEGGLGSEEVGQHH